MDGKHLPCVADLAAMIRNPYDVIDAGRAIARACEERGIKATVHVKVTLTATVVEFGYPAISKPRHRARTALSRARRVK